MTCAAGSRVNRVVRPGRRIGVDRPTSRLLIYQCIPVSPAPVSSTSRTSWTAECASISRMAFGCSSAPDLLAVGCPRQPRARAAPRRTHLLQPQHQARGDQRLRGQLSVLLLRAAEARRRRRVHHVARRGLGQAAAPQRSGAHRSAHGERPAPRSAVRVLHGAAARAEGDPARRAPEVLHGSGDRVLRRSLSPVRRAGAAGADGGRARFTAGRRRRDLRRARAPQDRARQVRDRALPRRSIARRTGSGCGRT